MLVRSKCENKTISQSRKLTGLFLCNTCVFHNTRHFVPSLSFFNIDDLMKLLLHGHISFFLVTSKTLFMFWLAKFAIIFILKQLKILNKELKNKNQMLKTHKIVLAGYTRSTLETVTKPNYIFKYPFYYQTYTNLKEYPEKRYILKWKSPLNSNKT